MKAIDLEHRGRRKMLRALRVAVKDVCHHYGTYRVVKMYVANRLHLGARRISRESGWPVSQRLHALYRTARRR